MGEARPRRRRPATPPVIQADYPISEDGLPGLEDSIFAYLRHRDDPKDPVYTCQLLENWRMNHTLSRFPAETLYGRGYAPATDEIGERRIALAPAPPTGSTEEGYLEWILDPVYPLVLCVLENVQTTIENPIEATLVARLTRALRERLIDPDSGSPTRLRVMETPRSGGTVSSSSARTMPRSAPSGAALPVCGNGSTRRLWIPSTRCRGRRRRRSSSATA